MGRPLDGRRERAGTVGAADGTGSDRALAGAAGAGCPRGAIVGWPLQQARTSATPAWVPPQHPHWITAMER